MLARDLLRLRKALVASEATITKNIIQRLDWMAWLTMTSKTTGDTHTLYKKNKHKNRWTQNKQPLLKQKLYIEISRK